MGVRVEELDYLFCFLEATHCRTNRITDSVENLLREAREVEPGQKKENQPEEGLCCSGRGEVSLRKCDTEC